MNLQKLYIVQKLFWKICGEIPCLYFYGIKCDSPICLEGQNIQEKVDKDVEEKASNIDLRTEEIEKEEIQSSRKKRHIPSE